MVFRNLSNLDSHDAVNMLARRTCCTFQVQAHFLCEMQ
jgi:hypothetical protein